MIFVPETPLLNIPQAAPVADALLECFRLAGGEYARTQTLSPDIIRALEKPMISRAKYLRGVNGDN